MWTVDTGDTSGSTCNLELAVGDAPLRMWTYRCVCHVRVATVRALSIPGCPYTLYMDMCRYVPLPAIMGDGRHTARWETAAIYAMFAAAADCFDHKLHQIYS